MILVVPGAYTVFQTIVRSRLSVLPRIPAFHVAPDRVFRRHQIRFRHHSRLCHHSRRLQAPHMVNHRERCLRSTARHRRPSLHRSHSSPLYPWPSGHFDRCVDTASFELARSRLKLLRYPARLQHSNRAGSTRHYQTNTEFRTPSLDYSCRTLIRYHISAEPALRCPMRTQSENLPATPTTRDLWWGGNGGHTLD